MDVVDLEYWCHNDSRDFSHVLRTAPYFMERCVVGVGGYNQLCYLAGAARAMKCALFGISLVVRVQGFCSCFDLTQVDES